MEKMWYDWLAYVLLIVGGLNWGLVGALELDLVELIFGSITWLQSLVYILVGLSAIYVGYLISKE